METIEIRIRVNKDIGSLLTIDRPKTSCIHRSPYCDKFCYNNKMYKIFKLMNGADEKNEIYWQNNTGQKIGNDVKNKMKRRKVKRFRFMSRGEAFKNISDIDKVIDIVTNNKDIVFHIPTRAWRDKDLNVLITNKLHNKFNNVRIFASIDPSNTIEELKIASQFCSGTMYFGNNEKHPYENIPNNNVKFCPKTWKESKKVRCFNC